MNKNLPAKDWSRFQSNVSASGGCHLWIGRLDKDGYGLFFFHRKNRRAHRVAYYAAFGAIPADMVVNHVCRNRSCQNPQHLQLLTRAESSMKDSANVAYINSQKTHCKNGHPYDRHYGKQRYCSICEAAKTKRLREKWKQLPDVAC